MNLLANKIRGMEVFLASKSPRRQELLKNIIENFQIITKEIKEEYPDNLAVNEIAPFLSELKAKSYLESSNEKNLFITADTIVVIDNKVLGKPTDFNHAEKMLKQLSGNKHTVYTGVSILYNKNIITFQDSTKVTFYDLKDREIEFYINNYQPFDKAGSYGIQEWMGYVGIKKMEGDFFNVMGLPIHKVYREIEKLIN